MPDHRKRLPFVALALLPALAGCGGGLSDFSIKDQEWFSRPSRMFSSNLNLETPPLSNDRPAAQDDLISSEGFCSGMAPEAATAMADPSMPAASGGSAGVAIGRTECEVARVAGQPDQVNITANERGERSTVLTYMRGPRPGIYRFTAGRMVAMERGVEPAPAPRAPKGQKARRQQG